MRCSLECSLHPYHETEKKQPRPLALGGTKLGERAVGRCAAMATLNTEARTFELRLSFEKRSHLDNQTSLLDKLGSN